MTPVVAVQDLAKTFRPKWWRGAGAVRALDGVSLSVEEGTVFGLLGANGAGKSTLVKALLGIVRPTSGSVRLWGMDPRRAAARASVGYQPEDARIPDYHTARTFLACSGLLAGLSGARLAERIGTVLAETGIAAWRDTRVRQFSKGMRQRLMLAQALLAGPRLLFLDEPTDGLDPVGRVEVRDLLIRLKKSGVTVFLNSHILSEVEAVCDRVMILDGGKAVASETVAGLTDREREWEILLDRWEPAWEAELRGMAATIAHVPPATLKVRVPSENGIDRVVDFLRGRGAGIRGLARSHATLEQVFLSRVGRRPE